MIGPTDEFEGVPDSHRGWAHTTTHHPWVCPELLAQRGPRKWNRLRTRSPHGVEDCETLQFVWVAFSRHYITCMRTVWPCHTHMLQLAAILPSCFIHFVLLISSLPNNPLSCSIVCEWYCVPCVLGHLFSFLFCENYQVRQSLISKSIPMLKNRQFNV